MEYLIPIVLVLLLVSGFVTFLVLNATRQSKPSEAEGGDADPRKMAASDDSPLGDTTEHAGEQTAGGETTHAPEGEGTSQGGGEGGGHGAGRGGEGGRERAGAPAPESEQLADRHQV